MPEAIVFRHQEPEVVRVPKLNKVSSMAALGGGTEGPPGPEGPQGPPGAKGDKGDTGATGATGPQGVKGDQGIQGVQGPKGDQGVPGPQGVEGPEGPQGDTGTGITMQGSVATSGDLPPTGNKQGDAYIVQADDSLWIWDGTAWVSGGSIQGPPGATGPQGVQGPVGPQGAKGDQGIQGVQGPKGDKGDKGDTGATGAPGAGTDPTKVAKAGDAMTGDLTNTGHFITSTADYMGFKHIRLGQVGYSMYNNGAVAEWLMYQPDHTGGDDFRIAAKAGPTITDHFRITTDGTVWTRAINAITSLTLKAATPTDNPALWLNDENGVGQGALYWNHGSDQIILQRLNAAGNAVEGALTLGSGGIVVQGDITADRGSDTGYIWFGTGGHYFGWNGVGFVLNGAIAGDIGVTGKYLSTTSGPYGFSHSANNAVGYHLYNQGATSEWLIYQPAHATGDDFRIAARGNNVNTDALTITPGNLKITTKGSGGLAVTGGGPLTTSNEFWVGAAGAGAGVIRWGGNTSNYLYHDGNGFILTTPGPTTIAGSSIYFQRPSDSVTMMSLDNSANLTVGGHVTLNGTNATVFCKEVRADIGNGTGAIWLGPSSGNHYLYYDGTKYILNGADLQVGNNINALGTMLALNSGKAIFQHDGATGYLRTQGGWGDLWLGANGNNYVKIAGATGHITLPGDVNCRDVYVDRKDGTGVVFFGGGPYIYMNGTEGFAMTGTDTTTRLLKPIADNAYGCGTSSRRWANLYATTGLVNTSDEREKAEINSPTDALLDAWAEVEWVSYKWKDAVATKGHGARLHIGLIAQRVAAVLKAHGLDGFALGLLCYDEWDEQEVQTLEPNPDYDPDVFESESHLTVKTIEPAGNRYGVRYDEALALEAALARRERARMEARIAALEA